MKNKRGRRSLKTATVMLAAITTVVWLILVIVKYVTGEMNASDLFDDILSNILGILPPIIIFNFAYEYVTKDYVADEISEEITQTLMSNPKALEAFDSNVKRQFIRSTISSLVGPETTESVYGAIEPYLLNRHNIRSSFEYSIEILNYNSDTERDEKWQKVFRSELYYKVKEIFSCTKLLAGYGDNERRFKIGLFSDLGQLDSELKDQKYLFRESLCIAQSALAYLSNMTDDEKVAFVENTLKFNVFINNEKAKFLACHIDENGINIDMEMQRGIDSQNEIEMDICFYMPQLKNNCGFLVSVTEPTYRPRIHMRYDETTMQVKTYSFLNVDTAPQSKAARMPGEIDICPSGWVYPVKGVVFIVSEV